MLDLTANNKRADLYQGAAHISKAVVKLLKLTPTIIFGKTVLSFVRLFIFFLSDN